MTKLTAGRLSTRFSLRRSASISSLSLWFFSKGGNMANSKVFTGADGSITLSPSQGPEGDKAKDVISAYEMLTVGRVQQVRVEVSSDVKAFNELGQRYATELRAGNVSIQGSIGRAYINGAMLKLLLGEAADKRPKASW